MAFKMKGFPKHGTSALKANGRQGKLKKGKLLKSEMEGTEVTGGSTMEKIIDLEDRIGFIKEDVSNQEGGATAKQKKDMAAMENRIAKLREQKK